jgi:phosphopantetheinyl transferase
LNSSNLSIFTFVDENIKISILKLVLPKDWKEFLLDSELIKLKSINHLNRQLEFITSRFLRTQLFGKIELNYNEYGAPVLGNHHLSISHSTKYVAFSYDENQKTAIDIDFVRPNIQKIFPKFAHQSEYDWIDPKDDLMQMRLWSMKEALYKHYQKRGIIFASQLKIVPIAKDIYLGEISGIEKSYQIKIKSKVYPEFGDLIISHTFGEIYYL